MVARRGRWVLAPVTGAALVVGAVIRLRARRGLSQAGAPADAGFMRAVHAALRRDLSRLRDAAAQLDGSAGAPPTVLAGWDAFRAQLDNHHWAEDDDLWPVLRGELPIPVTWPRSMPWWRSTGISRPRSRAWTPRCAAAVS
jgi:hypothetical protein